MGCRPFSSLVTGMIPRPSSFRLPAESARLVPHCSLSREARKGDSAKFRLRSYTEGTETRRTTEVWTKEPLMERRWTRMEKNVLLAFICVHLQFHFCRPPWF